MYKIPGLKCPPLPDVPDKYLWDVTFDGAEHPQNYGVLNEKNAASRWENVAWLTCGGNSQDTLSVAFGPVGVSHSSNFEFIDIGLIHTGVPSYEDMEKGLALIAARAWMGMV